jgi:hypothetical protein
MVVALVALVIALGGTGYAVTQLPKNSVGTAQIKKNAVTAVKVRNNAITGAKVKDGSLTARDFQAGTLLQGATGAQGLQGATGPPGPTASTWASNVTRTSLGSEPATVLDTGPARNITVTTRSRLVISGVLNLTWDATAGAPVECFPVVIAGNGDEVDLNGLTETDVMPRGTGVTQVGVPVTGSADVDPGTYRVTSQCYRSPGAGEISFESGNLIVVATAI